MVDKNFKTAKVLGIDVNLFDFSSCVEAIIGYIESKKGAQVVTINPEMFETAQKNSDFKEIIFDAEFVVPDGVGVKLALKLKGINQPTIPGVELSSALIEYCAKNGLNVALIGTKQDILEDAVSNLTKKYENLKISYSRNGFFTSEEEGEIIGALASSEPSLVLVALGSPKQEFFIKRAREVLKESIFIGVGGSFDVWAGRIERAPLIFRKLWLEWLYRTIKEPKRFKRIFPTLPLFLFKVIMDMNKR
ncbi:WecB/TagA/CpsF family glycosyltransferase [bacterium]|nr:WecB/TagA/CpsF family glycosyltransferase [bacterium]